MPKRRRARSRRPRRRGNRRFRRKRLRRTRLKRLPIGGLPNTYKARLRYADHFSINAEAGSIGTHTFAANGLYDVDISGAGHQAYGFDQLMAYYQRATVIASRITVRPFPTAASNVTPGLLGVCSAISTTEISDRWGSYGISGLLEPSRYNKMHNMIIAGNYSQPTLSVRNQQQIKTKWRLKKAFGRATPWTEPDLANSTSANPTTLQYFTVFVVSPDESNDPGAITFQVIIDYIVLFHIPTMLVQS